MKLGRTIKQLALYLIVGGIATVAEWACFYLFNQRLHIYYMLATALAFVVSTFVNWLAGRLIMFKSKPTSFSEIIMVYTTSIIGLLFNLAIMWVMVDGLGIHEMISKITATGIVFFWNFLVRKLLIYKI